MAQPKQYKKKSIEKSDPGLMLNLIMSLTDDTCCDIQKRINTFLREECDADLMFQVIVHCERREAFMEVVGSLPLPRKMRVSLTHEFLGVLETNRDQMELLSDFNEDIQKLVTPHVPKDNTKKRVVMLPITGKPFTVIFCVVGARVIEGTVLMLMRECAQFVWPTLKKAIAFEYEDFLKVKCQKLLRVAKRLFTQVVSYKKLLEMTMDQGKRLLRAEFCVIMMIDVEKKLVYDICSSRCRCNPKLLGDLNICGERRFSFGSGIVGEVVRTGKPINAKVASEHPSFDPLIDSLPDINCRNILCFPIREQTGMLAVGLLINKIAEAHFERIDEEMALAFSIYCGACIFHSIVYKKIQEAHIRNTLTNELITYHIKVYDEEVSNMMSCKGYHYHPHFNDLRFNTRALPLRELPCYAMKMFTELGFVKKFDIKPQKLARFILYVKKAYRDIPYHNWTHAFNVAQWAYASLVNYKLISQGYFTDLQAFMYLLAGFLHDIDHCGTSLVFQVDGSTTLASLYSSEGSMMERHHVVQALCVLNKEGSDILESLPRKDYDKAIMMLRDNILATDLTNYFKHFNEYKAIAMNFHIAKRGHFNALQCLLMNAADLSDEIKDWSCVKKSTAAVLTEFYNQGDLERMRGTIPLPANMNMDKCCIPDLEIEYLRSVIIPLFQTVSMILPKASPYTEVMEEHIEKWVYSKPAFAEVSFSAGLSVLLSPELDNLIELNIQETERLERERVEAELAAARAALEEESD